MRLPHNVRFFSFLLALSVSGLAAGQNFAYISGTPIAITVGGDTSFQIQDADVGGVPLVQPFNCFPADMGVFVRTGGILYAPRFGQACFTQTSALGAYTPWTPVSVSGPTGTGTSSDPYKVVVVADAGSSGLRLRMEVIYINGRGGFLIALNFSSATAAQADVFLGSHFIPGSYFGGGIPFYYTSLQAAGATDCKDPPTYQFGHAALTPAASFYRAGNYSDVWSEIGKGDLSSTVQTGCVESGAALEWKALSLPAGGSVAIYAATVLGTATPPTTLPNLTPYQPSGWSDKIIVSTTAGTNTDSGSLSPSDTLYVDWAVINNGSAATTVRFYTELYADGALRTSWYTHPPLNPGFYVYVQDYSIGSLSAGPHTIRIKADSAGAIAESNELDNEYTKTITISSGPACSLSCSASVPGSGTAGSPVQFTATATPTNCTGNPTYDWDFGDGSPHSSQQNPSHAYASPGKFTWTMVAAVDGTTCTRAGAITISISCSYSISPPTASFGPGGGTGSISVTAPTGCGWTATSSASWITITSGANGNGNGTVGYSVAANTGASPRTGMISVQGRIHTVSQAASAPSRPTVTLPPITGSPVSLTTRRPISLKFPLCGYTPWTAPITSVFDHTMERPFGDDSYKGYKAVTAFTNERALGTPCGTPAGLCHCLNTYRKQDGTVVQLGGATYIGDSTCPADIRPFYLSYDNHPGIDYAVQVGTRVYAAVRGTVTYKRAPAGASSAEDFHTLAIVPDGGGAYVVFYVHLDTYPDATGQIIQASNGLRCEECAWEGKHVDADGTSPIALSGDYSLGPGRVGQRLHFEVQWNKLPVDPYGWDPTKGKDPYDELHGTGGVNQFLWTNGGQPVRCLR